MKSPPLPDSLVARLSRSVETRLGLHFPPERWADLVRGVRAAAPELGFDDVQQCAEWLVGAKAQPRQIDLLAAHLTVGETYFFREPKAFEALEMHVLPEIVHEPQRSGARRLRIWSAGCCTGEEAYSIAIAVTRAVPKWREWQISILGTDLNPRFLHKAAEGIYSQWSFRGLPAEIQRDYFHQTDNGRRFAIAPWIKTLVTFACLNFVEDVYPSLGNSTNAMDVIFCRNVVMYFAREQARRVVGNLHRALVHGGWLFASATEASPELFANFTAANFPGTVVYRKNLPPPRLDLPAPAVPLEVSHTLVSSTSSSAASSSELLAPSLPEAAAPAPSAKARTLANEGRLGEALAACDQAIALHKLDAASHYLRGMILQEQGALDEAAASLKRALFLDQDFVVAHFALGNLMQRRGRATDAKRSFENARALLRRCPAEAGLPESDGISAGRLLAILDATREANR